MTFYKSNQLNEEQPQEISVLKNDQNEQDLVEKDNLDLSKEIKEFCGDNKIDIEISKICTIENQKYNSYRRNKTENRQRSFLWI